MNQTHNSPNRAMNTGKADPARARTKDKPLGTDDIGLPADTRPDEARSPSEMRPDPARTHETNDPGRVPLEQNQQHPSDPLKPGETDEYGTRLEKVASKIVPPGHEVKDEDIFDPGRMTPDAPPVDNRS